MKDLKNVILEKLKIGKHIKSVYDPDELNNQEYSIDFDSDDFDLVINNIESKHKDFIAIDGKQLSDIDFSNARDAKNVVDIFIDLKEFLKLILRSYAKWDKELLVYHGHLEVILTSQYRDRIYYIYAISPLTAKFIRNNTDYLEKNLDSLYILQKEKDHIEEISV